VKELVDEWTPEPLCEPLDETEEAELASVPVIVGAQGPKPKLASTGKTALNFASFNFTGLASNEQCRQRAIDTLRTYGVGSCGPAGFYGTLGQPFPDSPSRQHAHAARRRPHRA
jgi:serine palmitoyltransferase